MSTIRQSPPPTRRSSTHSRRASLSGSSSASSTRSLDSVLNGRLHRTPTISITAPSDSSNTSSSSNSSIQKKGPTWHGYVATFLRMSGVPWTVNHWARFKHEIENAGFKVGSDAKGAVKLAQTFEVKVCVAQGIRISDGKPVYLRVIDADSKEPDFLRFLNDKQKQRDAKTGKKSSSRIIDILADFPLKGAGIDVRVMVTPDSGKECKFSHTDRFATKKQWLTFLFNFFKTVAFMHAQGMAHGDLIDNNVIYDDTTGCVTLLDLEWAVQLDPIAKNRILRSANLKIDAEWAFSQGFPTKKAMLEAPHPPSMQPMAAADFVDPRIRDIVCLGRMPFVDLRRKFRIPALDKLLRKMADATPQSPVTMKEVMFTMESIVKRELSS